MANITNNINLLQATQFQISIDRNYSNLTYFVQNVNHPGASVNPVSMPIPRVSSISLTGDTVTTDELSMDVLVDEDMVSYVEMYNWLIQSVQSNYETPGSRDPNSTFVPEADITLLVMSSHNNVVKKIKYIDCVPVSIGTISFQSTLTEPTPITFPITFRTTHFEIT